MPSLSQQSKEQTFWRKIEHKHRRHFSEDLREELCLKAGAYVDEDTYFQDLEGMVDEYMELAGHDDFSLVGLISLATVRSFLHAHGSTLKDGDDRKPIRRLQKSYNRRVALLECVLKGYLADQPAWHKLKFDDNSTFLDKRLLSGRIQCWETVTAEWNQRYPHDVMSPETIKREFCRAKREDGLRREFVFRRLTEFVRQYMRLCASSIGMTFAPFATGEPDFESLTDFVQAQFDDLVDETRSISKESIVHFCKRHHDELTKILAPCLQFKWLQSKDEFTDWDRLSNSGPNYFSWFAKPEFK